MNGWPAWVWLVLGVLLMLAELVVPSFFIFWFGLAACGLTGPLYMPPAEQPVSTEQTPAQPKTESTPQAASPATATPASEAAPQ